jgi:outer membrane protein, heavy metal efflux system
VRDLSVALAVCLAFALLGPPAAAEPPPPVDAATLSLEAALALALDHAPKLQEARARVALARLDVRATQWWQWLIPTLAASQGYDFLAGQERAALALSFDVSKFLGKGAREAEAARIGLAQAERAVEVARAEVVAEVTRAVYQRTATRAAVEVREEAVAQAVKLRTLEAIRFEYGTGDLAPLLHAEAALARARLELLSARQEAALAELALLRAAGLPLP